MFGLAAPTEAEIQAHYDKYKNVVPNTGEYGFGYELPDRVKLQWLTLSRDVVKQAILPDAVEIEKRFIKLYPTGQVPSGLTADEERNKIQTAVVNEQADKILKTADQAIRAELDKARRKLDPDGDYVRLPADWVAQRPSFDQLAKIVVSRVEELHSVKLPKPGINNAEDRWLSATDFAGLPGIGTASLQVGSRTEPFTKLPMLVKELDGNKTLFIQAGVACSDPVQDGSGNRYYFMITEARKRSAPDSISDVRDQIARDIRRLGGYQRLTGKMSEMLTKASVEGGLETLARADPNAEGEASRNLTTSQATVDSSRFSPADQNVDSEELRKQLLQLAVGLDPTVDIKSIPEAQRVLLRPVPKSLGVFAARINSISPVTIERLRSTAGGVAQQMQRRELPRNFDTDPFTLAAMEKRLGVEYLDGRNDKKDQGKDKPAGETKKAS
jgi:hypothetical protein